MSENNETIRFTISSDDSQNPWSLECEKNSLYKNADGKPSVWLWLIDGQVFNRDDLAAERIVRRVNEKITGERILKRKRGKLPEICGDEEYVRAHNKAGDGWGCRAKERGYYTMLCNGCPIADEMQAEKEGLNLKYLEE